MFLLGVEEKETAPAHSDNVSTVAANANSPGKKKAQHPVNGTPRKTKAKAQILSVDKRCLSCSGQAPTILSAFKMACLQYNPSPVKFHDVDHNRHDFLFKMEELLGSCQSMFSGGPSAALPG